MRGFAGVVCLFCFFGYSQGDDLDRDIQRIMAESKVPGLSLAVLKHGKIVRLSAYGYASLEWKAKTTPDTRFEIASMSKMFTGAAARILIEEGKLSLEDPLEKYFGTLPESWKGTKVRHLVTMSNGIPDDWGTELIPYSADVTTQYDDASMLKAFQGIPLAAPVGTEFNYSSPAYSMLGMIVSKLSGKSLADFMQENIFLPAELPSTSFIDNSRVVPQVAQGYRLAKGEVVRGWYLGQYLHARPDVGLWSTARDMANWLIALDRKRVVKDPEKLWEGARADSGKWLDYSYGWVESIYRGQRRVGHDGRFRTGFRSTIDRFIEGGVDVVVLTNIDSAPVEKIAVLAATKYGAFKLRFESVDSAPENTKNAIAALASLGKGKVDLDHMMPNAFEPAPLAEVSGFLGQVKNFRFSGRTRLPGQGVVWHGHRLVEMLELEFTIGNETPKLVVYLNEAGKIAYVQPPG